MRPRKKDRHLPAKVYHRHGAYYYVHKKKWTRIGSTLTEALAAYASITSAPKGGMVELLDRVLEEARERCAEGTVRQYEMAAAKLKPAFAEFSPEQVTPTDVARFMDHYRDTPNAANRCRTVLNIAMKTAIRAGLRESNPVEVIAPHKEGKRDRYVTHAEYQRLLKHSPPALQAIIQIAYLTGQRIGDVLAIRREDVTEGGISFQQQKTGARLMVSMTPELQAAVDEAKAVHGKTAALYLLGQRNGKIRSYRGVRDLMKRAAERAGIADITLHDLRAKSLTDAKRQGLNATALAGHTTEAQTVRYIRSRETAIVHGPSIGQSNKTVRQTGKK